MSLGGGRGKRGAPSGRLTLPVTLVVLLLAPALLSGLPNAEAQRPTDPWWGPTERSEPTEGWAIRVPVVIENNRSYSLFQHVAFVELDYTKLLVEAGWTSKAVLADKTLQGFSLDVDSIRVVQYGRGFASGPVGEGKPLPHTFYPAMLTAERTRDFSPSTNPAGTVAFVIPFIAPGEKLFFYIYANPLEFGKTEPAEHKAEEKAPLDALLWGTSGTTFYGYQPQQRNDNHRLEIMNGVFTSRTTVTVYQYSGGGIVPVPGTTLYPNPMVLDPGASTSFKFPFNTGAPFKIESDNPIRVAMHGNRDQVGNYLSGKEANAFVPSTSNSFAGQRFYVYGFVLDATGTGRVTVMRAGNVGSVTVTDNAGTEHTLTGAEPIKTIGIAPGWNVLRASAPVLVSHTTGVSSPFHGHPVPARTGGAIGTQFYTFVPTDGGYTRICPEAETTLRVIDVLERNRQLYPVGNRETTPAAHLEPSTGCHIEPGAAGYPTLRPVEAYATVEPNDPVEGAPNEFRVLAGAGTRSGPDGGANTRAFSGPFGGVGGTDYYAQGPLGIFGQYDGTKVTIVEEMKRGADKTTVRSLAKDTFLIVPSAEEGTGRYHITANKPFTATSVNATERYGHYLGGRPLELDVTVGAAEFRGPLVSLKFTDAEGTERTKATGPETPVGFQLELANRGKWINGGSLPDTFKLTCNGLPDGWKVTGCGRDIRLESGASERLEIEITPSADDVDKTRVITVEAKSTSANLTATLKLRVKVTIVYGLDMRFYADAGPRTIDPPTGLDPGERFTYAMFVKNTGSSRDTFTLEVDPPREGWTQALLQDGERVDQITLEGGESTMLQFVVTAPNAESAPQNLVTIKGQSLNSANANAVLNVAARIRPNVDVRLTLDPPTQVAEPNKTARFNLTLLNSGNDIFRILLRQDGILPEGWTSRLEVTEIDLGPGVPFTFGLDVVPPANARAGDLATVKIAAETDLGDGGGTIPGDEVGAVVVVRRIHNLTTPAALDASTKSGETLAYVLPITNDGNGDDAIELLPGAVTPSWRVTSPTGTLTLERHEKGDLRLAIEVPGNATPGPQNLTLTLRLSRETTQNLTIPLFIEETARIAFTGLEDLRLLPGQQRRIETTVTNTGNVRAEFALATDAPSDWNVTFVPAKLALAPNEKARVIAFVNASRDASDGAYPVTFSADPESGVLGKQAIGTTLARADLYIERVQTSGRPRAGDLVLVTASIGNRGATAAENVTVALVVDGAIVDRVALSRIPVGEPRLATLSWLATGAPGSVSVVIDPEETIVQTNRDQSVAEVQFASRIPMPALPFLLVIAATAAIGLRRWRA